mmetsp:Transcript_314/g.744  ORF Transcript_314/g.744 Transcript_314/m.744 type:complete len:225 (-) Transcript_314:1270-1944(-)
MHCGKLAPEQSSFFPFPTPSKAALLLPGNLINRQPYSCSHTYSELQHPQHSLPDTPHCTTIQTSQALQCSGGPRHLLSLVCVPRTMGAGGPLPAAICLQAVATETLVHALQPVAGALSPPLCCMQVRGRGGGLVIPASDLTHLSFSPVRIPASPPAGFPTGCGATAACGLLNSIVLCLLQTCPLGPRCILARIIFACRLCQRIIQYGIHVGPQSHQVCPEFLRE